MDLPVTVTEENVQPKHTDNEQAALYAKLKLLDEALINLKTAGMLNKAAAAEIVVNETRTIIGALASSIHALMNETERLRADLDYYSRHGFNN